MSKQFGIHVCGPLVPFVTGFLDELARQGFSPWSATSYLVVMRHLSHWLEEQKLEVTELTTELVKEFVAERRSLGYAKGRSTKGMIGRIIGYLNGIGAISEVVQDTASGQLETTLNEFATYLLEQRGLTRATICWYMYFARQFLSFSGADNGFECLNTEGITAFMLAESRCRSTGSLNNLTVALRALLRFLYLQGYISLPLENAVLTGPGWRDIGTPRALSGQQIAQLLATCNRQTSAGCRNFALLNMLARLGLRSKEVVSLTLDDVNWHSGEITVNGKGNRYSRLPLPVDVGEALADYCCKARPDSNCRTVFLLTRAPFTGLSSGHICDIVKWACHQAGLPPAGAHSLRHSAATAMRRAGVPLFEIGQVLRHSYLKTTAHYAKDDVEAMAMVTRKWPGDAV